MAVFVLQGVGALYNYYEAKNTANKNYEENTKTLLIGEQSRLIFSKTTEKNICFYGCVSPSGCGSFVELLWG